MRLGQDHTIRNGSADDGGRGQVAGKICGLFQIGLAAESRSAAAEAKWNLIFGEDVCQSFHLPGVGSSKDHALPFCCQLIDLFHHGGNGAVKAHRRLRRNLDCLNNFLTVAAPGRADLLLRGPRNFLSDLRVQILTLALTLFCLNFLCWLCSSVSDVWLLLLILIWFGFLRVSVLQARRGGSPWWKFR